MRFCLYAATATKDDAQKALAAARKAWNSMRALPKRTHLPTHSCELQFSASVPEFQRAY